MIPKECKRLAEVDFPIADVSRHAVREKSIRQGHPSTLLLWWARRPLASCRAMLLALLLPDPCDPSCPHEFKETARKILPPVQGGRGPSDSDLRQSLLTFIANFSSWELAGNRSYLEAGRALVKAAHGEEAPLAVDAFAGGASIPLEALRLSCDVFAMDLNPLAVLINQILLEDVPRYGNGLSVAFKTEVARLRHRLKEKLEVLYPPHGRRAPAAYLWSRTVRCEEPGCGAKIPLLRSLWLSRSRTRPFALRFEVTRQQTGPLSARIVIFSPVDDEEVAPGTVRGGTATCPTCTKPLRRIRVEAQLRAQQGGTDSATLIAVICGEDGERTFEEPTVEDREALTRAEQFERELSSVRCADGRSILPDETLNSIRPSPNARGLSAVTRYGFKTFSDCHHFRQRLALATILQYIATARVETELEAAVRRCLLALLGRCVDRWSSCCRLDSSRDTVTGSFSKQALQLVWDFCEASPFSLWSGSFDNAADWILKVIDKTSVSLESAGQVHLGDARSIPLPDASAAVWFTDPPYYDSVPYADLADFFFCWLSRAYSDLTFRDPYDPSNRLTPKTQECVWNKGYNVDGIPKSPQFFETCARDAFTEGRRILQDNGIGCIVFAHKSTEGWEAFLNGIVDSGLVITSSWPVQTEMTSRTAARNAASLMGSVHLVCRAREKSAGIGDWSDILRDLPVRITAWMERLSREGVQGADLVFSCIGPALELFSRYRAVETAEGRKVELSDFLEKVWAAVGRSALAQVLGAPEAQARTGAAGAIEEDARLSALFLWTLQSTNGVPRAAVPENHVAQDDEEGNGEEDGTDTRSGSPKGFTLTFDVARRFAQPLGIDLAKWEGRIIDTRNGVVRLLPIAERARQLFGPEGAQAIAARLEQVTTQGVNPLQGMLFPEMETAVRGNRRGRSASVNDPLPDKSFVTARETTTLDRVHAAMLLQSSGHTNALRALLRSEQERGPDFLRLANALSALYPKGSEEKRLLDAMLLAVPR